MLKQRHVNKQYRNFINFIKLFASSTLPASIMVPVCQTPVILYVSVLTVSTVIDVKIQKVQTQLRLVSPNYLFWLYITFKRILQFIKTFSFIQVSKADKNN